MNTYALAASVSLELTNPDFENSKESQPRVVTTEALKQTLVLSTKPFLL
ncbi:MAG: hypothetical protein O2861_16310 [Proteobacteria bacterium]|nr:hypothetical protein [Pseudomonadota bacterium]